jgi:hypothetical protein
MATPCALRISRQVLTLQSLSRREELRTRALAPDYKLWIHFDQNSAIALGFILYTVNHMFTQSGGVSYIVKPSWQKPVFFHERTRDISLSSNMNLLVFPTERFLDQDKNYQLWRIIPAWLSLCNRKMIYCTIAAPITASQLTSTVLFRYTLYV